MEYREVVVTIFVILSLMAFAYADSFIDNDQSDFDNGTYINTTHNGSSVILSGDNLTGIYTSQIFDAGDDASWDNFSWQESVPSIEFLFGVDGGGDVYKSIDLGYNWSMTKEDYGRASDTEDMGSDDFYLYIVSVSNKEVFRSGDFGGGWEIVNDTFANSGLFLIVSDTLGNLFVVDGSGDVYLSSDFGETWILKGDFNAGATANPKGIAINSSNALFVVDGNTDIFSSVDQGENWIKVNDGYGGGAYTDDLEVDSNDHLYILFNSEIYKSANGGVDWLLINGDYGGNQDGLEMLIDSQDNFFIIDSSGDVYLSTDYGLNWSLIGDFNLGARNYVKGFTSFVEESNLSFQVKNCSLADCSDGIWETVNFSNINLTSRYFQYRVIFESPDSSITPELHNVTIDYTILNSPPVLSILSPVNLESYSVGEIVNLSFVVSDSDDNLDSCWYNLNDGANISLPNCLNTTLGLEVGEYLLNVFANDTEGAIESNGLSFSITNAPPTISLIDPQDGATYGANESLPLNFTAFDVDDNLDSCWYNLNGGSNISLPSCLNATFNVSGDGDYALIIYANDTNGGETRDSATFSVQVGAPAISLSYPINVYLNSGQNIEFRYIPTDVDLGACELLGNFTGIWQSNQTDFFPINSSQNIFSLNLSDGIYKWNIKCNDSQGNSAFNGNKTFYVDTVSPRVVLSEPTGTKNSRAGVPLIFLVDDLNTDSCWYDIYRGENIEKLNTSVNCSGSSYFSVTVDANFVLNFYVNDSAGNLEYSSTSFTVDTSTPPSSSSSSSGGGGGGSGGSLLIINKPGLQFSTISNILVNKGGVKKILSWKVENNGSTYLNDCGFRSLGERSSWITYTESKGLAEGEEYSFVFDVNIPEGIEPGEYKIDVVVECKEANVSSSFLVEVIERRLDFALIDVSRDSDESVKVVYSIEDVSGEDQNVDLQFLLFDLNGMQVAEVNESRIIKASSKEEFEILIPIDETLEGQLNLLANLNSETFSTFIQESVFLGSTLSGFTIFNTIGRTDNIAIIVLVVLFLGFSFFIIRRIRGHKHTHREKIRKRIKRNIKKTKK